MNTLFIDTETTSKADMRAPLNAPHQPYIVQLAAILMDSNAREIMSMNIIIRPDGWLIPDEAAAIHGITTEFAEIVGVPMITALNMLRGMKRSAETFVAHNIDFDNFMVKTEIARWFEVDGEFDFLPESQCFCTMKAMTDICRLPGPYGYKFPKLQEAYKHAFGSEFDGAHDALADVRACARIFHWLKNPPELIQNVKGVSGIENEELFFTNPDTSQ